MAPSSLGEVPPGFDQWFFKATSKKPSKRFASVEEMDSALHKILAQASASGQVAPWPRRILNLPSQSEVRLAYSAVATWPGHALMKARAVWLMAAELLVRLGREVTRLAASTASKARASVSSEQLALASRVLSRPGPGLAMAVIVVLSGITLVGLSSRTPDSVAASNEPAFSATGEASAPPARADVPAGATAANEARQESEESATPAPSAVVLSALPAPADAAPAPATASAESHSPSPSTPARATARGRSTAGPSSAGDSASAPATRPITLALAKAAAKILDNPEQSSSRASPERRPAKTSPKAQETRPQATPAPSKRSSPQKARGSGAHPFDDRL